MRAHVSWGGKLRPGVKETNVNDENEWEYQRQLREDVMGGLEYLNVARSMKTQQFDKEVVCNNTYPFEMTRR